MKTRRLLLLLAVITELLTLPTIVNAQTLADSGSSSGTAADTLSVHLDVGYKRPTREMKLRNYFFDAYGPYPIANAAVTAGINQEKQRTARVEPRSKGIRQAIRIESGDYRGQHNHALCAGRGFQGRHSLLPV